MLRHHRRRLIEACIFSRLGCTGSLCTLRERQVLLCFICKSGKQHKSCSSALCTMDDASFFLVIRLGPKTSESENNVTVVSTVTGCDVTDCATTLHGFNKHASSRREAVSDSRSVPRCTEKNPRLLTCVDHSTRPHEISHVFRSTHAQTDIAPVCHV